MKLGKFNSRGKTNSGFPTDPGVVSDKVPVTGTALSYMISGALSRITLSPQHLKNILSCPKDHNKDKGSSLFLLQDLGLIRLQFHENLTINFKTTPMSEFRQYPRSVS